MVGSHGRWPSQSALDKVRQKVVEMSGRDGEEVRFAVSPYRICPLGAHIDHQGGTVTAMTINHGILLGFVPSSDAQVYLQSGQFKGEVRVRVDEVALPIHVAKSKGLCVAKDLYEPHIEEAKWGDYVRGALYALQKSGNHLAKGITGFICGSGGLDSSGLSSSAAVGVAYLLALESANNLSVSPTENIEYDRIIENEYFGLENGILDQSAILLSSRGCLTCIDCKTREYKQIQPPTSHDHLKTEFQSAHKIMLAFSGLKQALTANPGYNRRVSECREAAKVLLKASGSEIAEPILSNVAQKDYEAHKNKLETNLARRAEHYFSENNRVVKGVEAWASGNIEEFGKLITESGLSSIQNYECGCEPLIQLYHVLLKAPGVYGARFSGAGFRGCCVALVESERAEEAAAFVRNEYPKLQMDLVTHLKLENAVLICDAGDSAQII
ncbi:unnamed protein product [Cuscuta epithymum]|uniref:Galacturonokinase n=1 Tax=Cuscuta epithymum TaxID=186058 RepID=A0AAV0DUF9_9ASTE|nr:unnamed protein product [Cuscuta epithymum]